MSAFILKNARLALEDRIAEGAVVIEDGLIVDILESSVARNEGADLRGAFLLPGLVDLHGDALEKEVEPRPGAIFPLEHAVAQADLRAAASGVTTAYHAVAFAGGELGVRSPELAAKIVRIIAGRGARSLVENRVHCRYEITDAASADIVIELLGEGDVSLLSFMDHTPGQGQFKSVEAWKAFFARTYRKSAEELDAQLEAKMQGAASTAGRVARIAAAARVSAVPMASHDDDSPERIQAMSALGATISEFPINLETARAARDAGMATLFGAPNVLRGQSQSGSMRAADGLAHGVASCLCSDYSPATLIPAVFRAAREGIISLPGAVNLVTCNPASAVALSDRGRIETGLRADLVAVMADGDNVRVTHTWRGGAEVFRVGYAVA